MVFIDVEGSGISRNHGFLSILKGPLQVHLAHSAMHFGEVTRFVTMSRGPGNDVDEDERAHTRATC